MLLSRTRIALGAVLAVVVPASSALAGPGPLPCVAIPTLNDRCPTWTRLNDETIDFPVDMVAGQNLVYTATTSGEWGNLGLLTFATNAATGAAAWRATLTGSNASRNDQSQAMALSPDERRLVVTGIENIDPEDAGNAVLSTGDLVTVAYDAVTGAEQWVMRLPDGAGHDVAVTSDRVYVVGRLGGPGGTADQALIAYDAATGEELWVATEDGPDHGADRSYAVAVAGDRVFVTGERQGDGTEDEYDHDATTIAYATGDGERLWMHVDDDGGDTYSWDSGTSLAVSPARDTLYLSARSGYQAATRLSALDAATGTERWQRMLPPWGFDSQLVIDPAGERLFLTGFPSDAGDFGLDRTYAFTAGNGATLWQATLGSEDWTSYAPVAYDLAIRSNGQELYIGGVQRKQTSMLAWDYVTAAFDPATGTRRWFSKYQTGYGFIFDDLDIARLIALRPDDSMVYTSGVVWRPQTVTGDPEGIGIVAYPTA